MRKQANRAGRILTAEISMNSSDGPGSTDPEPIPNPPPDPAESVGPAGWLVALNSFLERAFLKADVDTGC